MFHRHPFWNSFTLEDKKKGISIIESKAKIEHVISKKMKLCQIIGLSFFVLSKNDV